MPLFWLSNVILKVPLNFEETVLQSVVDVMQMVGCRVLSIFITSLIGKNSKL